MQRLLVQATPLQQSDIFVQAWPYSAQATPSERQVPRAPPVGVTQVSPRQHWLVAEHAAPEATHDADRQLKIPLPPGTHKAPQQSVSSAQGCPASWHEALNPWQRDESSTSAVHIAIG